MKMTNIEIPILLWWRMVRQLRKRGAGRHESGAFLLADTRSPRRVTRFICYDDLDETALQSGIVMFHAPGFVRLWNICEKEKLRVVADIHTHPGGWTGQSESDRTHPMIAQVGHIAIILPHFAQHTTRSLNGAGVYEYLGNHQWKTCTVKTAPVRITLL